jgi:hypothetical protein
MFSLNGVALAQSQSDPFLEFSDKSEEMKTKMEKSTFLIASEYLDEETNAIDYQYGSGFLVADGYIITNGHVLEDIPDDGYIFVFNKLLKPTLATIVDSDYIPTDEVVFGSRDLALLHFEQPKNLDLTPVTFNMDIKKLDTIFAWGYPVFIIEHDISSRQIFLAQWDKEILVPINSTTGTINATINGEGGTFHVHTATILGGNSGGPLVNGDGEVVGINTWIWEHYGGNYNLSQPSIEILAFLWKNGIKAKLSEGQTLPSFKTEFNEGGIKKPIQSKSSADGDKENAPVKIRPPYKPNVIDLKGYDLFLSDEWDIVEQDENSVFLNRKDGLTKLGVLTAQNGVLSLEEVATVYSRETNGTEPIMNENCYVFDFPKDLDKKDLSIVCQIPDKTRHIAYFMYGERIDESVDIILEESNFEN